MKLQNDLIELHFGSFPVTEFPVERSHHFYLGKFTPVDDMIPREVTHSSIPRHLTIETGKVARIEINTHHTASSRSSEMIPVISRPPPELTF